MAASGLTVTRLLAGCVLIGAALIQASCARVTYGTGTGAAAQTLKDMTSVFGLGQGCPIIYQPRPDLVQPPTNELPPPGTGAPPPDCYGPEQPPVL